MRLSAAAATSTDAARESFTGMPVAASAGLRLRPGSLDPVFDAAVWDLTGLADAPVVMGEHRKILDFTAIANPLWRTVAREYLLARMAPQLPAVATLPGAFRTPLNPNTLWNELKHLALWLNFLTGVGVVSLDAVTQEHCDDYLARARRSTTDPSRTLSPAAIVPKVRIMQSLALYSEILSDRYRPGFRPWGGRSADTVAGYVRTTDNRAEPVPDQVLRPLLSDCLYLLANVGPPLAAEAALARKRDERERASRRGLKLRERADLRHAIRRWHEEGRPAPQAAASTVTQRIRDGWDRDDPLLQTALHPLVVEACGAMGHRRDLEALRPELEAWVGECGVLPRWGRHAALIARHDDAALVPWTEPMSRELLDRTCVAVVSAAYVVTSALTGMRASELAELAAGCRIADPRPGGVRYRLSSRRIKGLPFGGAVDEWVVIQDVHDAVGVAETLTAAASGDLLFARGSNNSHSRISGLRAWIGGPTGRRLGLLPIPEGPISPRALRRTLALTIAQRPHGLMAARIQLKHISVATTEGYTARPGGHQAAFMAEAAAEEEAEHMRLTLAAYEDYRRGILPAGQGARGLIAAFKSVDAALADHPQPPATVTDDRRVERILKTKAATLHAAPGNYCWFSDPGKALCLRIARTPEAKQPLIGMCDSARCSQATHHLRHRQIWADHAEHTRAVFLGTPRIPPLEQARARQAAERAERIVAGIDEARRNEQNR